MMRLLIVAVLLAVVQTLPQVPRKTAESDGNKGNAAQKSSAANQSQAAAPVPKDNAAAKGDKKLGDQNTTDSEKPVTVRVNPVDVHKDAWDYAYIGASLLIAIATLVIACIAWKQAGAAEASAQAALQSVNVVLNSQRPWLFIPMGDEFSEIKQPVLPEAGDNRVTHVTFSLKNFGQSPARVVEQKVRLYLGVSPLLVPSSTAFDSQDAIHEDYAFPQGAVVPIQAPLDPNGHISPENRTALLSGGVFLWLCGYCKYRSASDTGQESVYETRFCYLWINNTNRPSAFWIMAGPREYNTAT